MHSGALRSLARYGPFFALDVPAGPEAVRVRSQEFGALVGARVERVRDRMIGGPAKRAEPAMARACASLVHLDLVSRLLSPALGLAVAGADVSMLGPDRVVATEREAGVRFGVAGSDCSGSAGSSDSADASGPGLSRPDFGPVLASAQVVTDAVTRCVALPTTVTRSNTASAVAGAATVIGARDARLGVAATGLLEDLLAGPLRGAGRLGVGPGAGSGGGFGVGFRRAGCCLYYRLPGGGLCGDCVLLDRSSSVR